MEELKIYSVSDEYVEYLRKEEPNVYSNKIDSRTHTRKYIGIVLKLGKYNYYVPMSSPKESDYQIAGDQKVIKKSIVPIIRIVVKNSKGEKEFTRRWTFYNIYGQFPFFRENKKMECTIEFLWNVAYNNDR